jgi:predicted O-methyltransferase YrrM
MKAMSKNVGFERYPAQDVEEFEALCAIVRRAMPKTILEIGSRDGRSLIRLAEAAMPTLERVLTIDLPGGSWGRVGSESNLMQCVRHLRARGIDVRTCLLSSRDPEAAEEIARLGPIDFAFLDGDHTEAGVRADFDLVFPHMREGSIMAFHDIAGTTEKHRQNGLGVPDFWRKLRAQLDPPHNPSEIITEGKHFGIGVLWI